ncbi:MAG: sporulation protein YqfD [Clostridia bacterium]|nr:sporulation protein YqfD [Clostridia bacterium]
MIINFLRLILGFVEFEAKGGFPERFLNLCTVNGITLWQVQNDGVKVKACTSVKAYKNIKKSARNSGMKVKIVRKRGLPFFIKNNRARAGVLVGLSLVVFFLALSSCMLWNIEVIGNEKIKSEVLMESLSNNGVRIGVFKSKIDTIAIQNELLDEYKDLSWASINIFGTKAVLEVKENSEKPKMADDKIPMNIIAKKDGQIVLVEAHKGTNVVKEGDVVVKGDLLISGVTLNGDGSEKTIHATGKVFANTLTNINGECGVEVIGNVLKTSENKYYLYALGGEIPLFLKCKGEKLYEGESLLKSTSGELPFGVKWEYLGEFQETEIELTENQTALLALFDCVKEKREKFKDECEVLKISYIKNFTDDKTQVKCKVSAKENIAEEKEIFVE